MSNHFSHNTKHTHQDTPNISGFGEYRARFSGFLLPTQLWKTASPHFTFTFDHHRSLFHFSFSISISFLRRRRARACLNFSGPRKWLWRAAGEEDQTLPLPVRCHKFHNSPVKDLRGRHPRHLNSCSSRMPMVRTARSRCGQTPPSMAAVMDPKRDYTLSL
jgi:hypothetical protein